MLSPLFGFEIFQESFNIILVVRQILSHKSRRTWRTRAVRKQILALGKYQRRVVPSKPSFFFFSTFFFVGSGLNESPKRIFLNPFIYFIVRIAEFTRIHVRAQPLCNIMKGDEKLSDTDMGKLSGFFECYRSCGVIDHSTIGVGDVLQPITYIT